MFKNLVILGLIFPLVAGAVESVSYISEPTSEAVVKKNINDLRREITALDDIDAKKVYDQLSQQKRGVTDQGLLNIYYVLISFLHDQSNTMSEKQLKEKLNSLLDQLNWIYTDHSKDKFSDKVTYLGKILNQDTFLHLDHKKMSECLSMAQQLKDVVEFSNIGNEINPEDGSDYFSSDFFLQKEIETSHQIYSQVVELEGIAKSFSENCEKLSQKESEDRLKTANDFINGLKLRTIKVGDQNVRIPRNTRKHLKNLASAAIEKLVERRNQIGEEL